MKENSNNAIIYPHHALYECFIYSSSSPAKNGLAISSVPSSGDTKLTCVPRITTRPNFLVSLVTRSGSSGSMIDDCIVFSVLTKAVVV